MPIYMDRHDLADATAEAVAKVHQEDLKIQDQYGCRGLTYWFDESRGTAFCLIEAPAASAVTDMHNHAHGMIPTQIIEVDTNLVNAFLGRIEDPDYNGPAEFAPINESAHRTIVNSSIADFSILKARMGKDASFEFVKKHKNLLQSLLAKYHGREISTVNGSAIFSFISFKMAVLFASALHTEDAEMGVRSRIGISNGLPVNKSREIFGETVQLATRLSDIATGGQTMISSGLKHHIHEDWPDIRNNDKTILINANTEKFLNRLMDLIDSCWDNADFTVHLFARKMSMSKAQLYRKITGLSGFSPADFIKEYRLKKAVEAIEKQEGNISEIAYRCCFNNPSYFSKCFVERFGILPSFLAASLD